MLSHTPALPASATTQFATILDNQATVRVQVFEQAGAAVSEEPGPNRRVLDGEFSGMPNSRRDPGSTSRSPWARRPAQVTADSGRSKGLQLEAFVEGVVDGAAMQKLVARTSAMTMTT